MTLRASFIPLLVLAALAAGCMGTPRRGILLPHRLKGATVTADGDEPYEYRQQIEAVVALREGIQVVRVEPARGAALVQRTRIFVNDPKAELAGENVILARIDQGMLHRTVIAFPSDPLANLGHDFEPPPVGGQGVVLLASVSGTAIAIDGAARTEPLKSKPGLRYDSYPTRALVVKLAPGKHRVEFTSPGFRPCAVEVEVAANEYQVIGATLAKQAAEPGS